MLLQALHTVLTANLQLIISYISETVLASDKVTTECTHEVTCECDVWNAVISNDLE